MFFTGRKTAIKIDGVKNPAFTEDKLSYFYNNVKNKSSIDELVLKIERNPYV